MSGSEREGKWKKNERRKWGKKGGDVCGSGGFVGRVFLVRKKNGREAEREKMGSRPRV